MLNSPSLKQIHMPLRATSLGPTGMDEKNQHFIPPRLLALPAPGQEDARPNSTCGMGFWIQEARTELGGPPGASNPQPFLSSTFSFKQTATHTHTHRLTHTQTHAHTTFVSRALVWGKNITYMARQKMAELSSFFLPFILVRILKRLKVG